MPGFKEIISANPEELMQFFYKINNDNTPLEERFGNTVKKLQLRPAQIICSLGFNPNAKELPELLPVLGYVTYDELARERNDRFTTDIYKELSLENILSIYSAVKNDPDNLQLMPYLLKARLANIEEKIETTVNSLVIDKYKAEMRSIYNDGIANIDFAEDRLNRLDSGFRALLNEVTIITESRIIPVGDIFFREMIIYFINPIII